MFSGLESGAIISFSYRDEEKRRVLAKFVADLMKCPLFIEAFLANPSLVRTQHRLHGYDYCRLNDRSFYDPDEQPCRLQLGIFDPLTGECIERIGGVFSQSDEDLAELIVVCENIAKDARLATVRRSIALFAAA